MESVYLETSVVSYLRQRPSSNVVAAARQVLTHRWWRDEKKKFAIYSSQFVMDEASAGNAELAAERLRLLEDIPLLPLDQLVAEIAEEIMNRAVLPEKARTDALHIAVAVRHRVQYLLTWNCRHIANARITPRLRNVIADLGLQLPVICTPEELLSDDSHDDND
ncbi:MAG: type II toxin-antitoxin system VapC family toxin [Planctomycetaceae bacterium]